MSSQESLEGTVEVTWLNEWTLAARWTGRGTGRLVAEAERDVRQALEVRPTRFFLCDAFDVTGYDRAIVASAKSLMLTTRRRGMSELVVVAKSRPIRGLAHIVGTVARIRTRVFATREAAHIYCGAAMSLHGESDGGRGQVANL